VTMRTEARVELSPALEATGIRVELGHRPVLDGVSVRVSHATWTCVVGPNGAGKTTLLHALAGLAPRRGEVAVDGVAFDDLGRRERARRMALVPQLPTIPPGITVDRYVLLGRTPHLGVLGTEGERDHEIVARTLERLDLAWASGRYVDTLSGGELRRAVIARALTQDAPILLLDEPTTGLDLGQQLRVLELVDELRRERGLTVLSTMHDLTLAGRFADRFVLLAAGRSVAEGTRDEVLSQHVIAEHYGAAVRILDDGEVGWAVVPLPGRTA
jgi:iron complex transport system ATP-binding protein